MSDAIQGATISAGELTEFTDFVNEFRSETDRAAVILGAAKLDLLMYQILKKVLLPSPNSSDELLDGDTPLSSLSAKILLLYRLGIIDAGFARTLHLIKRIRNSFAHEVAGSHLATGLHRDRVRELIGPYRDLPFVQQFAEHFFAGADGPGVEFRVVLILAVSRLGAILKQFQQLPTTNAQSFTLELWKRRAKIPSSA